MHHTGGGEIELQNYQSTETNGEQEGYSMTVRSAIKDNHDFVELHDISSVQKQMENNEDDLGEYI
jgi:hypothetical protein